MKISHRIKGEVNRESSAPDDNLSILMISTRGHFFSQPANPEENITNFHGWMNFTDKNYTMYKSIDTISLEKKNLLMKPTEILNNIINVSRLYGEESNVTEEFLLVKNGLVYDVDPKENVDINVHIPLDFRTIFDNDDKGRVYKIYREKFVDESKRHFLKPLNIETDAVVVEYSKYADNNLSTIDDKYYLLISGVKKFSVSDKWIRKDYHYDSSRKSSSTFYVYDGIRICCDHKLRMIFAFAKDKNLAAEKIFDIIENSEMIKKVHKNYLERFLNVKYASVIETGMTQDIAISYMNCLYALEGLSMNLQIDNKKISGLWAGIPWFFQFWARDEIISLKALMLEDRHDFAKTVLMKHLNEIQNDGRISNLYPKVLLGSADAIGWFFKRFHEFFEILNKEEITGNYLNLYDIKYVRERLLFSLRQIWKNYSKDGFIWSNKLETWMDTNAAEGMDTREGFRIEIQCLFLSMMRFMNVLNNQLSNKLVKKHNKIISVSKSEEDYVEMEREFARNVRENFFVEGKLYDGLNDPTCRPNIFLAHYLYPELLDNARWEQAFDYAIERLWCQWNLGDKDGGGFSTIDKNSPLYQPKYTGQDNVSYHRGDSWFWVNNLAAVAMLRLNKDKYFSYAKKILNASTEDILSKGYIGYASELTSGSVFSAEGCLCQTWSMATYIELIHEIYM